GGFVLLLASLTLMFMFSFRLGDMISGVLDGPLDAGRAAIAGLGSGVHIAVLSGLYDGMVAGAGIVLPYLLPLLFLLAVFEDMGFLPRIAFMADGLLHRVGLHGKSVIPIVLGYGCNVPGIMATRNLESRRDRVLTMLIVPFIACSARSVVILALVGKHIGGLAAGGVYLANIIITLLLSFLISRFSMKDSPGIIMDVPPLRRPFFGIVAKKVWLRLYEFLVFTWPVLIVSSVVLAILSGFGIDAVIDRVLSPLTGTLLHLPVQTGMALFLGFFRKELALVMLGTALGTQDVAAVLSHGQILVLVVFTMLYIPCVATVSAIWKEGGARVALASVVLNITVALIVAGALAQLV
ncbi:MAG: nucleoside recognition domain-containing protein, partial [Myxococcota bacterium]